LRIDILPTGHPFTGKPVFRPIGPLMPDGNHPFTLRLSLDERQIQGYFTGKLTSPGTPAEGGVQ
jgi:hypothetical protein